MKKPKDRTAIDSKASGNDSLLQEVRPPVPERWIKDAVEDDDVREKLMPRCPPGQNDDFEPT